MTQGRPGGEPERPGPAPRGQRVRPLQGEQGGHAARHLLPEDDGGHDFPGSLAVAQDEPGEGPPLGDASSLLGAGRAAGSIGWLVATTPVPSGRKARMSSWSTFGRKADDLLDL